MDAFWKWLMRANARGVFLSSILALLLVTTWWVWKEYAPLEDFSLMSSSKRTTRSRGDLGILAYLKEQLALGTLRLSNNPFLSPMKRRLYQPDLYEFAMVVPRNPLVGTPEPVRPPVRPPIRPPVAARPPPVVEPAGPPVAALGEPKTISLTYRGLLERPDGSILALIEDSESNASSFYGRSRDVFGMKIGKMNIDLVAITSVDGQAITLRLGEPIVFEGVKDAN